jgi:hypothetical protein
MTIPKLETARNTAGAQDQMITPAIPAVRTVASVRIAMRYRQLVEKLEDTYIPIEMSFGALLNDDGRKRFLHDGVAGRTGMEAIWKEFWMT